MGMGDGSQFSGAGMGGAPEIQLDRDREIEEKFKARGTRADEHALEGTGRGGVEEVEEEPMKPLNHPPHGFQHPPYQPPPTHPQQPPYQPPQHPPYQPPQHPPQQPPPSHPIPQSKPPPSYQPPPSSGSKINKSNSQYYKLIASAKKATDYANNEMQYNNIQNAKNFLIEALQILDKLE
jgi:hypothetical protein